MYGGDINTFQPTIGTFVSPISTIPNHPKAPNSTPPYSAPEAPGHYYNLPVSIFHLNLPHRHDNVLSLIHPAFLSSLPSCVTHHCFFTSFQSQQQHFHQCLLPGLLNVTGVYCSPSSPQTYAVLKLTTKESLTSVEVRKSTSSTCPHTDRLPH